MPKLMGARHLCEKLSSEAREHVFESLPCYLQRLQKVTIVHIPLWCFKERIDFDNAHKLLSIQFNTEYTLK